MELTGISSSSRTTTRSATNNSKNTDARLRLIARVRPFLKTETSKECLRIVPNSAIKFISNINRTRFDFHHVLKPLQTQGDAYLQVSNIIQKFRSGESGAILAYGQIDGGKTYTLFGNDLNFKTIRKGIIQLSLEQLYSQLQLHSPSSGYKMWMSFYEIINNNVYDLFEKSRMRGDPLIIDKDYHGYFHIKNIRQIQITNLKSSLEYISLATKNRMSDKGIGTTIHSSESKSDVIFKLYLVKQENLLGSTGTGGGFDKSRISKLEFVDLAPSNWGGILSKGAKQGGKLSSREPDPATTDSLAILGNCLRYINHNFGGLGSLGAVAPNYEGCLLTKLLKKTLNSVIPNIAVFFCLSPSVDLAYETFATLKFSNKIWIGKKGKKKGGKHKMSKHTKSSAYEGELHPRIDNPTTQPQEKHSEFTGTSKLNRAGSASQNNKIFVSLTPGSKNQTGNVIRKEIDILKIENNELKKQIRELQYNVNNMQIDIMGKTLIDSEQTESIESETKQSPEKASKKRLSIDQNPRGDQRAPKTITIKLTPRKQNTTPESTKSKTNQHPKPQKENSNSESSLGFIIENNNSNNRSNESPLNLPLSPPPGGFGVIAGGGLGQQENSGSRIWSGFGTGFLHQSSLSAGNSMQLSPREEYQGRSPTNSGLWSGNNSWLRGRGKHVRFGSRALNESELSSDHRERLQHNLKYHDDRIFENMSIFNNQGELRFEDFFRNREGNLNPYIQIDTKMDLESSLDDYIPVGRFAKLNNSLIQQLKKRAADAARNKLANSKLMNSSIKEEDECVNMEITVEPPRKQLPKIEDVQQMTSSSSPKGFLSPMVTGEICSERATAIRLKPSQFDLGPPIQEDENYSIYENPNSQIPENPSSQPLQIPQIPQVDHPVVHNPSPEHLPPSPRTFSEESGTLSHSHNSHNSHGDSDKLLYQIVKNSLGERHPERETERETERHRELKELRLKVCEQPYRGRNDQLKMEEMPPDDLFNLSNVSQRNSLTGGKYSDNPDEQGVEFEDSFKKEMAGMMPLESFTLQPIEMSDSSSPQLRKSFSLTQPLTLVKGGMRVQTLPHPKPVGDTTTPTHAGSTTHHRLDQVLEEMGKIKTMIMNSSMSMQAKTLFNEMAIQSSTNTQSQMLERNLILPLLDELKDELLCIYSNEKQKLERKDKIMKLISQIQNTMQSINTTESSTEGEGKIKCESRDYRDNEGRLSPHQKRKGERRTPETSAKGKFSIQNNIQFLNIAAYGEKREGKELEEGSKPTPRGGRKGVEGVGDRDPLNPKRANPNNKRGGTNTVSNTPEIYKGLSKYIGGSVSATSTTGKHPQNPQNLQNPHPHPQQKGWPWEDTHPHKLIDLGSSAGRHPPAQVPTQHIVGRNVMRGVLHSDKGIGKGGVRKAGKAVKVDHILTVGGRGGGGAGGGGDDLALKFKDVMRKYILELKRKGGGK